MMTGPITVEDMKEYWQEEAREEAWEEALAKGKAEGMAQIIALIEKGVPLEEAKRLLGVN